MTKYRLLPGCTDVRDHIEDTNRPARNSAMFVQLCATGSTVLFEERLHMAHVPYVDTGNGHDMMFS